MPAQNVPASSVYLILHIYSTSCILYLESRIHPQFILHSTQLIHENIDQPCVSK